MATAQAKVQELVEEIGELSPADRAKLLARLLAQEERFEDTQTIAQIRQRNARKSERDIKANVERVVSEVRRARGKRTTR